MAEDDLEVLYREAQAALKAKDYARASELLKQILLENHDYKDVSRLLAQVVNLRRRRWYNHPFLWSAMAAAVVLVLGFAIAPRVREIYASQIPASTPDPTGTSAPADTPTRTETIVPMPTSIPLVWKRLYLGQEFARDTVSWFGMDSTDKDVLYLGMENAGTYQSIDGGLSWKPITPSAVGNISKFDSNLEFTDDGIQFIRYTAPDGKERIYYYVNGGSWFVSENGGENRREFYIGGTVTSAIAFSPDGEPYLLCDQNICKFSPDGKQKTIMGKPGIGEVEIIVVSPHDPNTIFAGGVGLAISNDGGLAWTKLNNGLGNTVILLNAGSEDHRDLYLREGECKFSRTIRGGLIQPLYNSTDGGRNWNFLTDLGCQLTLDVDEQTLFRHGVSYYSDDAYGGEDGWIWRSPDRGTTWQKLSTGPGVYLIAANPHKSGELLLFSGISWLREYPARRHLSEDYGDHWITVDLNPNIIFGEINNLYFGPETDMVYLLASGVLFQSRDNGITWIRCAHPFESNDTEKQLLVDPRDGQRLLVSRTLNSVYESRDGCDSWTLISEHVGNQVIVNTLALDPNNPDTVYAGTDGGAYVSFDGGQTWGQINDGLLGATVVYSIVVDKEGNVYAATPYGIFKLESK